MIFGLAFYKSPSDDTHVRVNWDNLIFSSGEIAAYLWTGLEVLKDNDVPLSRKPTSIIFNRSCAKNISNVIEIINEDRISPIASIRPKRKKPNRLSLNESIII